MSQNKRLLFASLILVFLSLTVLGLDYLRGAQQQSTSAAEIPAGAIPIYLDGRFVAYFSPADLEQLPPVSFIDPVEGKEQSGWLLRDVLALYLPPVILDSGLRVQVSSTSRVKSAQLTWDEVARLGNNVMFDLSGRGTLKLVSTLEKLDVRDEWVQDVDRIEVFSP